MVVRNLPIVAVLILSTAAPVRGQDLPNPQAPEFQALQMQLQIKMILMTRSPESEAAGRAWLQKVAPDLMAALDSLKQAPHDQYWTEIAQLAAQQGMVSNILSNKDSARADVVTRMFGLEARARAQQRAYRTASAANRPAIRAKLEPLMAQHFDLEDRLMRFPCSYMIYSEAFDSMPRIAKERILRRVWEVLKGADTKPAFKHLSSADRQNILEILTATKKNLPAWWGT